MTQPSTFQPILARRPAAPPETAAAAAVSVEARLASIEDKLARIERVLDRVEGVERDARAVLAMGTDVVDRAMGQGDRAHDLQQRLSTVLGLVEKLTSPEIVAVLEEGLAHHAAVTRILRSGAFDPAALDIVGKLAAALAGAAQDHGRIGMWGAVRAAGTEPVQHALGFAVSLAARFGSAIADGPARPALPEGGA